MKSYSVTTVLGVFADFGFIRSEVLEAAIARGNAVHAAAATYAGGMYVPPLPREYRGYFDSFKGWFDSRVRRVIFIEKRLYNVVYYFDGQPDLGCELADGRLVVVDYKTPAAESPTWKAQIAAYCDLAEDEFGGDWDGMSLRLRRDGKPAIANVYDSHGNDFAAFLAALTAYRYFKD